MFNNQFSFYTTGMTETNCKSAVHMTLISASGLKQNMYADAVQNVINAEALFE